MALIIEIGGPDKRVAPVIISAALGPASGREEGRSTWRSAKPFSDVASHHSASHSAQVGDLIQGRHKAKETPLFQPIPLGGAASVSCSGIPLAKVRPLPAQTTVS